MESGAIALNEATSNTEQAKKEKNNAIRREREKCFNNLMQMHNNNCTSCRPKAPTTTRPLSRFPHKYNNFQNTFLMNS